MRPLILIVEDEVDAAEVLALVLEQWGYDTMVCHDGREGYQLAVSMLPDIILADYNMPHMSGLQLAEKLTEEIATASIPFILMTALYEMLVSTININIASVIKKPCDLLFLQKVLAGIPVKPSAQRLNPLKLSA